MLYVELRIFGNHQNSQNIPKYTKIYQNIPKYTKIAKIAKIYQNQ